MQKPPLVAVDTNFPLLLADEDELALDALEVIRTRLPGAQIIVPPTAVAELAHHMGHHPQPSFRALAAQAFAQLRPVWRFHTPILTALHDDLAANAARRVREAGLLPFEECNDALILAESAVLNSVLLVSEDSHLLAMDHWRLSLLFRELDLPVPLVTSPRDLIRKFYH
jgi:predicted nucleic acid-binding protein